MDESSFLAYWKYDTPRRGGRRVEGLFKHLKASISAISFRGRRHELRKMEKQWPTLWRELLRRWPMILRGEGSPDVIVAKACPTRIQGDSKKQRQTLLFEFGIKPSPMRVSTKPYPTRVSIKPSPTRVSTKPSPTRVSMKSFLTQVSMKSSATRVSMKSSP